MQISADLFDAPYYRALYLPTAHKYCAVLLRQADVAQLAEHPPCKRKVMGSSPIIGSSHLYNSK